MKYLLCIATVLFFAHGAYAVDDIARVIEEQRAELVRKEDTIKKETERLKIIKKEVEEDIVKYTQLLKQIDKSLQKAEEVGKKRMKHVAKAYEAMQPEDGALRLAGLDTETAVQILLMMNSKKAGLIIGMMEKDKATRLTKNIAKLRK